MKQLNVPKHFIDNTNKLRAAGAFRTDCARRRTTPTKAEKRLQARRHDYDLTCKRLTDSRGYRKPGSMTR